LQESSARAVRISPDARYNFKEVFIVGKFRSNLQFTIYSLLFVDA
jgi:hypothetical protein